MKRGASVDVFDGVAPLQGLPRKQIEMTPACGSGGTEYRKAADPCSQVRLAILLIKLLIRPAIGNKLTTDCSGSASEK